MFRAGRREPGSEQPAAIGEFVGVVRDYRGVDVFLGVADRQVGGHRVGRGGLVVDLHEDRKPLFVRDAAALGGRQALEVGGVLGVVGIELARELDLVDQRPDVQVGRVLAGLARVGAGRDAG